MRSRLSYYSVLLLVGLAITSGLVLVMNPFNSAPANASAPTQGASPAGGVVATNSTAPNSVPTPAGDGSGSAPQPGGILAGEHHHHDYDSPGEGAGLGNSTVTITTSSSVYSQNA
jgi:hypothetical protein